MDRVFKALADRNRRRLLDRLLDTPGLSLSELGAGIDMRRQSLSKHLDILIDAGLVQVQWRGRERLHYLNPVPIGEISDRWIDKFSKAKVKAVLNLKQALEEKDDGAS